LRGAEATRAKHGTLVVSAPVIDPPKDGLKPARVARHIEQPKIDKGWEMAKIDPKEKEQLREKMRAEGEGVKPDEHPAKAVNEADVKIVHERAKAPETAPPLTGRSRKSENETSP